MGLVFIDLETGGLDPARHPITQIAAVAVDQSLVELDAIERKVDFDMATADPEALKISSYSREVWDRESVPQPHAIDDLSRFLKRFADLKMTSRAGNPYHVAQLAGYNAATFDGPFLQAFYRKHDTFMPAGFRVMDAMQRVLWHFHERPAIDPPADFKLGTVCQCFGVPLVDAHDALADCRATVELYRRLVGQPVDAT